jgi:hypothetical protein
MKKVLAITATIVLIISCNRKHDYEQIFSNPDTYCKSVYELNSVVMGNNFSPVVASRNYLYANIAAYEVIAAGYPDKYNSLAGQLHGLANVPKPEAGKKIDFEFASLLSFWKLGQLVTFSENRTASYVDSVKQLAKDHGMPSDVYDNSVAYADTVGNVIMAWSKKDNYAVTRGMPEYTVMPDSPARWVPTPPAYTSAMEPHWREIRTLVIDSPQQFMPLPPYEFNVKDTMSNYGKEVKKIQHAVDTLTDDQKWIADFWDDNPFKLNVSGHLMFGTKKFSPPGHWMSVVGIAAKKSGADYNETVYAYTKTAIALFDAFIQCWNIKYTYNTARPETIINKYYDQNWQPHLQTPPFPEYTCGHCTISAAASEVLSNVFGDNFPYTDTTELEFGIKSRDFKSFRDAAIETYYSRFYGGIHYYYSCERSNKMGIGVGDLVVDKLKMKKN